MFALTIRLTVGGSTVAATLEDSDTARAFWAALPKLAVFYRDFDYSAGLVLLGRIDADLDTIAAHAGGRVVTTEVPPHTQGSTS
jgi:hypothetical protein